MALLAALSPSSNLSLYREVSKTLSALETCLRREMVREVSLFTILKHHKMKKKLRLCKIL